MLQLQCALATLCQAPRQCTLAALGVYTVATGVAYAEVGLALQSLVMALSGIAGVALLVGMLLAHRARSEQCGRVIVRETLRGVAKPHATPVGVWLFGAHPHATGVIGDYILEYASPTDLHGLRATCRGANAYLAAAWSRRARLCVRELPDVTLDHLRRASHQCRALRAFAFDATADHFAFDATADHFAAGIITTHAATLRELVHDGGACSLWYDALARCRILETLHVRARSAELSKLAKLLVSAQSPLCTLHLYVYSVYRARGRGCELESFFECLADGGVVLQHLQLNLTDFRSLKSVARHPLHSLDLTFNDQPSDSIDSLCETLAALRDTLTSLALDARAPPLHLPALPTLPALRTLRLSGCAPLLAHPHLDTTPQPNLHTVALVAVTAEWIVQFVQLCGRDIVTLELQPLGTIDLSRVAALTPRAKRVTLRVGNSVDSWLLALAQGCAPAPGHEQKDSFQSSVGWPELRQLTCYNTSHNFVFPLAGALHAWPQLEELAYRDSRETRGPCRGLPYSGLRGAQLPSDLCVSKTHHSLRRLILEAPLSIGGAVRWRLPHLRVLRCHIGANKAELQSSQIKALVRASGKSLTELTVWGSSAALEIREWFTQHVELSQGRRSAP